jgi:HEPN domain-containing protein
VFAEARKWLAFASDDLRAARLLLSDVNVPSRIACFHAQQAAEKALNAALVAESIPFRKTHDIIILVGLVPSKLSAGLAHVDFLAFQPWAVDGRYPGDLPDATPHEAVAVVDIATAILAAVDQWLSAASSGA